MPRRGRGRKRTEGGEVELSTDGQQHAHRQAGDGPQGGAVGRHGPSQVAEHGAEGQVDQRLRRSGPPVRQRRRPLDGPAEADRGREWRRVQRCREPAQVRHVQQSAGQPGAEFFQRGGCRLDRRPLPFGRRDRDLGSPHAQPVRDGGGGVLARLPDDYVGPPLADLPLHRRPHRAGGEPSEQFPVTENYCLRRRRGRQSLPDRRHLALRWLSTGPKREAGVHYLLAHRGRCEHNHLGAVSSGSGQSGQQRIQVASPAHRTRPEHPHADHHPETSPGRHAASPRSDSHIVSESPSPSGTRRRSARSGTAVR